MGWKIGKQPWLNWFHVETFHKIAPWRVCLPLKSCKTNIKVQVKWVLKPLPIRDFITKYGGY